MELMDEYVPQKLLFREVQIEKLRSIFSQFKKYKTSSNLLLTGSTGGGKTTTLKFVLKDQDSKDYILITGRNALSSIKLLQQIANSKSTHVRDLADLIIDRFKKNPQILIIDEIKPLKNSSEFFDALNYL